MKNDLYLELETSIAAWCAKRPDILAAVVIGSRGRQARDHDPYSDLDLILFSPSPGSYEQNSDWLSEFGEVWLSALDHVASRDPEWMAYFAPGLKADFLLVSASADQTLADMLDALPYQKVLARGFRILYLAEGLSAGPVNPSAQPRTYSSSSEWEFRRKVNVTLFTAERFVKFSIRGDAWRCQYTFDAELKSHLLAFIEWHAQTMAQDSGDVWYEGRHMEAWADQRVIDALPALRSGPTLQEQQAALLAFLELLELVAGETAARLGYDFPDQGQRNMIAWLRTTMSGATG